MMTKVAIDAGYNYGSGMYIEEPGIKEPDVYSDGTQTGGMNSYLVLGIVIAVCVALGVFLGILSARRNAKK